MDLDRDYAKSIKRSTRGAPYLSVSIVALSKTKSFKRDLAALRRIRAMLTGR